jgi:predicted ATPase
MKMELYWEVLMMKTEPETRATLKKLTLTNFKNFKQAELTLGPFTLLVGANATGKSNIREAFRFLHGIGRGYGLADIIGEKWIEGGVRVWSGIRGGTQEISYFPTTNDPWEFALNPFLEFGLGGHFELQEDETISEVSYCFNAKSDVHIPLEFTVSEEFLKYREEILLSSRLDISKSSGTTHLANYEREIQKPLNRLMLSAIEDELLWLAIMEDGDNSEREKAQQVKKVGESVLACLKSMRFLDLNPDAMRIPSFPGQNVLGDRGENFSSVLYTICQEPERKEAFLGWIQELTPMDAVDFEFPPDQVGRILVTLVERGGQKTSAYSASDGTLRFLGMLAALFHPEPAELYFFEELENGIHPNRLHLLIELIEQVTAERGIQVIATTHSPLLLDLISEETLEYASLVYRLEGSTDGRIQRILDIPHARKVLNESDLGRLFENGWLENSALFMNDPEPAL